MNISKRSGLISEAQPCVVYDVATKGIIGTFESRDDCAKFLGKNHSSQISVAIKIKSKMKWQGKKIAIRNAPTAKAS